MNDPVSYNHEKNQPCPVVNLAIERFGELGAHDVLYNCTCFPFNDDVAMVQLKEAIVKADAGMTIDQLMAEADAKLEASMAKLRKEREDKDD